MRLLFCLALMALPLTALADPPASKKVEQTDVYHGVTVKDPYRWLEDAEAKDTQDWVKRQNEYTRAHLDDSPVRAELIERLTKLWDYPRYSSPFHRGERYFFFKNDGLQNQAVFYVQEGLEGEARVAIDPNKLSDDGTTALSDVEVSDDGKLCAYAVSVHGSDWQEVFVRDLDTGQDLSDKLEWCKFTSIAWTPDNKGFFYSRFPDPSTVAKEDQTNFNRVYYHRVGDAQADDQLVFKDDEKKHLGYSAWVTEAGDYVGLTVWDGTDPRNRVYVRKLEGETEFRRVLDQADAAYSVIGNDGPIFYLQTDKDAPRGRIVALDVEAPGELTTVIPEDRDVIDFVGRVHHEFVVVRMHNAHHLVSLYTTDGKLKKQLELPGVGAIGGLSGRAKDTEMFLQYESYLTPATSLRYDFPGDKLSVFRQPKIDFPADQYRTEVVFCRSQDGTAVPIFLTYRKDLERDGSNPTLLYGYGGFNINLTPRFSISRLAWLERGGILAVANLRGGSEYGEEWHQAGMMGNKQNVFDDFIAAGEYLIEAGYTRRDKLAINGGSNGGLLVSACLTQRPDLYGAALCQVPVTDMLRYHLFTVGRYWVPEWGSADDPEQFKFLYAYSPLHNTPRADYPATLITTADTDDRVVPAHAKKFAATLQAAQTGSAPILIRIETKAGHGAGKPTSKLIEEAADCYTFLLKYLGE